MLAFAPLVWITVRGVDAASLQSLFNESSIQSTPFPESQRMTRRLNIFESFAKSEDQRQSHNQSSVEAAEPPRDSFDSDDDKTVNEILRQSLVELTEIIETMTTHLIPTDSIESLIVFQSLLKMLSIPKPSASDYPFSWQKYLSESIRNLNCSVTDLCRRFKMNFKCNQNGQLNVIILYKVEPPLHLNLLMIPRTVERLSIERCGLTSISAWSDLRGKSLKSLRIHESEAGNLKLNLDGLQGTLDYLPLETLSVRKSQISEHFGLPTFGGWPDSAFSQIGEWMRCSTLLYLREVSRISNAKDSRHPSRGRKCISFCRDGTWMLD